jgi:hypothetical protein
MRGAMRKAVARGLPAVDVLAVAHSVVIEDVTAVRGRREMELYLAGMLGAEAAADYRAASPTEREELDRHIAELVGRVVVPPMRSTHSPVAILRALQELVLAFIERYAGLAALVAWVDHVRNVVKALADAAAGRRH